MSSFCDFNIIAICNALELLIAIRSHVELSDCNGVATCGVFEFLIAMALLIVMLWSF